MADHKPDTAPNKSAVKRQTLVQVARSRLSLSDTGYCLRSIDHPNKALLLAFDGRINVLDNAESDARKEDLETCVSSHEDAHSILVHAVVGIFALERHKYVLVATNSHCRGTIRGSDIYEISAVRALPLDKDSGKAAFHSLLRPPGPTLGNKGRSTLSSPALTRSSTGSDAAHEPAMAESAPVAKAKSSSMTAQTTEEIQPVSESIGSADMRLKWLSPQITKLFSQERGASTDMTSSSGALSQTGNFANDGPTGSDSKKRQADTSSTGSSTPTAIAYGLSEAPALLTETSRTSASLERMEMRTLDEITRVFSTSGLFFSYEYDLTRSLQVKGAHGLDSEREPLANVADSNYWFNHNIQLPLLAQNGAEWALPLIQGCVQVAYCQITDNDFFQICLLSRRSCKRIGLRYERRGADSSGHVANFVETEQILVLEASDLPPHYASFVQTRGSMPFFWKQPASGLQPLPVVTNTSSENVAICAKHLQRESSRFGRLVLLNLVEHKGREAIVGSAYANFVGQCVSDELIDAHLIRYVPWDFHHETRGMRYDNVKQLVMQLQRETADMGYFWHSGEDVFTRQQGVFRVNCMDCLDRTNVVQSSLAGFVLNEQLVRLGVHAAPEQGLAAYPGLETTLNNLWANNGDYISRQYAGTLAMKGDFTRTGRRNIGGVVNDATYSLARLWIGTFRDYFSQSVLDFVMGSNNVSDVFRALVDLRSREPDHVLQMVQMRQGAVETSVAMAVNDGELVQLACIVHSPMAHNTTKLRDIADSVLAVTDVAVYICRYDYQLEKVSEFLRIELSLLAGVRCGAYITDTRTPQGLDPTRNHGLVLFFPANSCDQISGSRISTSKAGIIEQQASLPIPETSHALAPDILSTGDDGVVNHFVACKMATEMQVVMQVVPATSEANVDGSASLLGRPGQQGLARLGSLEKQSPDLIAECLSSTMLSFRNAAGFTAGTNNFIIEAPIISAATAKQNTSFVDKVANKLHNALWI
ncbi:hypothetical protein COEREDRAFT_90939 [Coemansia reversa NRRL 1564]|uniref:SAC domain-containing protein n=1 Tax=Coemansia reversa (strain ATCC 12441 / NRRL 1564) TaxID=763665 RepID=A0A2G5BJ52_COERN|nr:hypothetical protein COEREDRAFT_90939 [Coemansia reversa NRRL 1564]|eukprot:PIA19050.1 hypothetical protein COEREDRAFT_90939 [Coemansia reversa NRRL 1564]